MARAHFVKKAAKDNPVVKKGEPYWWWKHMVGGRGGPKRYSKTRPRPSQLTQSEFLGAVYSLQEEIEDAKPTTMAELQELRDEWADRAGDIGLECQDKFENLPDAFQQSDPGQLLEDRSAAMDDWASELQGVDLADYEEGDENNKDDDNTAEADMVAEKLQELLDITPDTP